MPFCAACGALLAVDPPANFCTKCGRAQTKASGKNKKKRHLPEVPVTVPAAAAVPLTAAAPQQQQLARPRSEFALFVAWFTKGGNWKLLVGAEHHNAKPQDVMKIAADIWNKRMVPLTDVARALWSTKTAEWRAQAEKERRDYKMAKAAAGGSKRARKDGAAGKEKPGLHACTAVQLAAMLDVSSSLKKKRLVALAEKALLDDSFASIKTLEDCCR